MGSADTSAISMRAVDTNLVVRLVVRDNAEQLEVAEKFTVGGAWVSHLVLAETTWVLDAVYERTSEQIAIAVDMLLNHDTLILQDADVVTSALEQFRKRPALDFSDCLVLESARRAGHLPLGTFDRDLAKLDGAERVQ
jgi:predicted nucleic-acid-binding protein